MAKPFSKIKYTGILGLDDQFTFGRYIGSTVLDILKDDPSYVSWLMSNTSMQFYQSVHDELFRHVIKRIPQHSPRYYNSYGKMVDYDHDTIGDWDDDIPF